MLRMLVVFLLFLFKVGFAQSCDELSLRLERVKQYNIYEELVAQSQELLKVCQKGKNYALAIDYILNALETIYQEGSEAGENLTEKLVNRRIRNSLLLINKSSPYRSKYPTLYFYQLLFHTVAVENRKFKDYRYALKYSQVSSYIGRALLQLK